MFPTSVLIPDLAVGSFLSPSGMEVLAVESLPGVPFYSVTLKGADRTRRVTFHASESVTLV